MTIEGETALGSPAIPGGNGHKAALSAPGAVRALRAIPEGKGYNGSQVEWQMVSRDVPKDVKELVDLLGQAFVHALVTDEAGQGLLKQIQERGFEVGILVEATVALHSKSDEGDAEGLPEESPDVSEITRKAGPDISEIIRGILEKAEKKEFEWSEEDRAMLCNFRISLD
jgi:hypothetical protein